MDQPEQLPRLRGLNPEPSLQHPRPRSRCTYLVGVFSICFYTVIAPHIVVYST